MAEFTIDINFNLNTSGIEEAEERLESLKNSANMDSLTEQFQEATSEVERLKAELEFAEEWGFLNDVEELQAQLVEAEAEAENLATAIQNMDFSPASQGAQEVADNVRQASDNMGDLGNKTDETNSKMQETAESSMGLGEALVGLGGAVGLEAMVSTADNINTSWNRLTLTFEGTGVSMDTLKQKSSELKNETGRSGSEIRDYFNQMGIAGVTNVDLLSSSFQSLAGASYQTGKPIQTLQNGLQTMTLTGTASSKMLKNLGLSSRDLAEAMGVTEEQASDTFKSLSEEERLQALTKAMGDGTQANQMYKDSYAGLKAQAQTSLGALVGAIGQSILPIVIPALNTAKGLVDGLTNAWKGLPAPVTSVLGAIGGGIMGITALSTAFSLLSRVLKIVWGSIGKVFGLITKVYGFLGKMKTMIDMVRNAESLSAGVKRVLATVLGIETVAEEGDAVAKASSVAPTSALAVAENSLLLPILLVIGAIVGLIAVLYYLYNNNEMVRNAINGLIKKFWEFIDLVIQTGQQIYTFVVGAITQVWQWVTGTTNGVNNLVNLVMTILFPFPTLIANVLNRVLPTLISIATSWVNGARQKAQEIVNNVYNTLTGLPSRVSSAINGVKDALTKPFQDAYNTIKPLIDMIGDGVNTLNDLNPFGNFEGFNGNVGFAGFGTDSMNNMIANRSASSNTSTVTNNFNINGIIEEEASEYIVSSVNNHLKRQNLIRGV